MRGSGLLVLSLFADLAAAEAADPPDAYYRWPAIRADTVVFAAGGDLWRVGLSGGTAQRLTTHAGEEAQPVISPDGRWLGFVGAYDSGPEVYVMPLAGGAPRRLSFDAARVLVQGFTAKGELLYGSDGLSGPSWTRQLRLVDPGSGQTQVLPVLDATDGVIGADQLWFTRFGLQVTTDNARGYRGGAMAQLWRAGLDGKQEAQRLAPQWQGNLRRPLLAGERLVVISDASGSDNLWSLALDGSDARQLTLHRDFEVRSASADGQTVVYALGADLRVLALDTGRDARLSIQLPSDLETQRQRLLKKPLTFLSSATLAPKGDRVALSVRGQVVLVGGAAARRISIGAAPQARLRSPVLSPDGRTVYAITDADSRSEIHASAADGSTGSKALTEDGDKRRWGLYLSPDGRWLAHDDKGARLWLLDLETGRNRLLDQSRFGPDQAYADVVWSPDSQWLVVARPDSAAGRTQLLLLPRAGGKPELLSSDRYPSFAPAFSADGRWLYFLSSRHFQVSPNGPWGDRNTGAFFDRRTKIYALALQADGPRFPFQPVDELGSGTPAAAAPDGPPPIDPEGLARRLYEVPLAAGNYSRLGLDGERLYLLDREAATDAKPQLKTVAIGSGPAEARLFAADVSAFDLSADRKTLFYQRLGADNLTSELLLVPAAAKPPEDLAKAQIKLSDWTLAVEPAREWSQMFDDAWRMHREFSFDERLRGLDWDAVRARYAPLVARITERSELDDLLGQMIAELGLLHSQVRQSELRVDPENSLDSFLGGEFSSHPDGGLEIRKLWLSEAELPSERGPLQASGLDVQAGDRLLAVNGRPVNSAAELSAALLNQAGLQTLVETRRDSASVRRWVVLPVNAERETLLRYGDWVQRTRAEVETKAQGQIGYLHLRAMGPTDMAGFVREFYANIERPALIIDVRRNRGGNIDSWVIEKLLRRNWAYWHPPGREPYWNMQQSFRGHLVVLADALTYSDGETFAAAVQAMGLAPVIGQRTAGAGIWLSDRNRLVDNGIARIAEFGQFDSAGQWLIEGRGVAPDIEVENLPVASARGEDAQLAAAISHLEQRLQQAPVEQPASQPIPPVGQSGAERARELR